jgi:hypothetical protein
MIPRSDAPASSRKGGIEVITGCMFSGKTEELLRRLRRVEIADQEVKLFKPSIDDRYWEEKVGSHSGLSREAEIVDPESVREKFPVSKSTLSRWTRPTSSRNRLFRCLKSLRSPINVLL